MKSKKVFTRIVSWILTVSLSVLQPMTSIAAALIIEPVRVEGTRFTEDQLIEGNLVYFGVTGMTISEGHGIYEVPLYREGDLSKEASVTIHSLDISGLYKDDYALLGENKKEYKSEKTILEIAMTGEAPEGLPVADYEFDEYGNLLAENGIRLIDPEEMRIATWGNALWEPDNKEEVIISEAEEENISVEGTAADVSADTVADEQITEKDWTGEEDNNTNNEEVLSELIGVVGTDGKVVAIDDTGNTETVETEEQISGGQEDTEQPGSSGQSGETETSVTAGIEENPDSQIGGTELEGDSLAENGSGSENGNESENNSIIGNDDDLEKDNIQENDGGISGQDPIIEDNITITPEDEGEGSEENAILSGSEDVEAERESTQSFLPITSAHPALALAKAKRSLLIWPEIYGSGILFAQETSELATASNFSKEEEKTGNSSETVSVGVSMSGEDMLAVSPAVTDDAVSESAKEVVSRSEDPDDYEESELLSAESDQSFAGGKSRLAVLKEKATGEPTRETVSTQLGSSLTESILGELIPEAMKNIPHSAEQVITFEPEEDVKWVRFRLYDDRESEGTETFSLVIMDTEGVEPYIATSLSVIISDNEETVLSKISFDEEEYPIINGMASVGVRREEAVYSLATANISGKDPATGEETVYGTVAFAPYETEKTVDLYLKDPVELSLTDLTAAEDGEIMTVATVNAGSKMRMMASGTGSSLSAGSGLTADNDELTKDINIGGNNYEVRYKKGDLTGGIYDKEHYDPALEVGQYYFSTSTAKGGIFTYGKSQRHGDKPWGCGVLEDKYVIADSETDYAKGYGDLEYYHTTTTATGSLWTSNDNINGRPMINGLYYRYLIPDWEETSSFGGGNKVRFKLHAVDTDKDFGQEDKDGKFGEELSSECAVQVKNICDTIEAIAYAVDDTKLLTPKSYLRFYGLAAMYKKFRVSVNNPTKKSFKGSSDTVPMQLKVQCGAQLINPGGNDKREIYANLDEDKSNLVFTVLSNQINGVTDIFGKIVGYNITISGSNKDNAVKAKYPEDYISFLKGKVGKGNSAIDYSSDTINGKGGVIERVQSHLDTICFDKYFIDWIETQQKMTFSDGLSGKAYYQELNFEPVVDYITVPVTVVAPDKSKGTCGASFNDAALKVKEGTFVNFHAGDKLNFAATPDDTAAYRVTGFEISEDNGAHYNIIRDNYDFTLLPNRKYMVRPLLEKNDNHVEIIFDTNEAKNNLQIENLIPDSELASVSYLKGKNVLELNPLGKTVTERMKPKVGAACTVRVLVTGKPSDSNYVYRPVITDRMTGKAYNAQGYSFIMRSNTGDNVIRVGIEKVKVSELEEFNINARAMSSMPSIRNDGLGLHSNPATGYTVSTENGEAEVEDPQTKQKQKHVNSITSVAGTDGSVSLSGLKAKVGDRITLLISNGFNDEQVAELVIVPSLMAAGGVNEETEAKTVEAGKIEIGYPVNAPRVASLAYDYDKASSREKTDLTKNQVRCFNDNLTLSASVNGNGRTVEKLVFTVVTVTGAKADYEAKADSNDPNLFTVKINDMLENLHNGDRITVYAVDKEKRTVNTQEGGSKTVNIVYPIVETGLVAYVENERLAPKEMNVDGDMGNVNIPVIGTAKGNVQSGILNISRTDWPDKQGYSLSVNFDMLCNDPNPSPQEKWDKTKAFAKGASMSAKAKREAIAHGKDAANAGYSADHIRKFTENGGKPLNQVENDALNDF